MIQLIRLFLGIYGVFYAVFSYRRKEKFVGLRRTRSDLQKFEKKESNFSFSLRLAKEGIIEKRKTAVAKYIEAEASLFTVVRFLFHETMVVQASTMFRSKFNDPLTLLGTVYQPIRTLTKKRIKIAKI